ncbi:hypothetical protein G6O67_003701 [Ophiocordyceps sinensis]|uniref:Uncharacterized protein n=2 Tax=Ophiocordyceps sinensis TaxID=72228 RepID=A0A8H4PS93_9HYPO|nr:hypothetical protein OCS_00630 [Ophiocordyceps sinensis CO18]KAF4509532.1 hypothetical protein G6O67_003701 [Ophiocordyceps sinensis]
MLAATFRSAPRSTRIARRTLTTLANNPHIKVFDNPSSPASYILTYLDTKPPSQSLAIGTCTTIPPSPKSFQENPRFLDILSEVVAEHGHEDEDVVSQAQALASPGGFSLGPGGFSPQQRPDRRSSRKQGGGGGAGGASAQGGAGGGGTGGWVHLSDRRNPPDFGRIAWPEDILGSVEVDRGGRVVGRVQASGTYRLVTNEGILGLSPFLREKLVDRLRRDEAGERTR